MYLYTCLNICVCHISLNNFQGKVQLSAVIRVSWSCNPVRDDGQALCSWLCSVPEVDLRRGAQVSRLTMMKAMKDVWSVPARLQVGGYIRYWNTLKHISIQLQADVRRSDVTHQNSLVTNSCSVYVATVTWLLRWAVPAGCDLAGVGDGQLTA